MLKIHAVENNQYIKIQLAQNPVANFFTINIFDADAVLLFSFAREFSNAPTNPETQIQIGGNRFVTLSNLLANLNTYITEVEWFQENDMILGRLVSGEVFTLAYTGLTGSRILIAAINFIPDFDRDYYNIEIIDTYENNFAVNVELTKKNSPTLTYDSGDDIYSPLAISTLKFNMQVPDASDALFFHLFTGDEQRYLVRLVEVDASENTRLVWQGFLLPDFYTEPYRQVMFFVDFEAVDMIGSLKGKTLPPWLYYNTLPVIEIFARLLRLSGLEQYIILKPGILPVGKTFSDISLDLNIYENKGVFGDAYEILVNILTSLGLNLSSQYGYWVVESFAKKSNATTLCEYYDLDGLAAGQFLFKKKETRPAFVQDTILLQALTPFARVNINVSEGSSDNLFSDELVKQPTVYVSRSGTGGYSYRGDLFSYWDEIGTVPVLGDPSLTETFSIFKTIGFGGSYTFTEANALLSYVTPVVKPYVFANVRYELEINVDVVLGHGAITENNLQARYENGVYDHLFVYSFMIGGVEYYSNRPSFASDESKPELDLQKGADFGGSRRGSNPSASIIKTSLKLEFISENEGDVEFRVLNPIGDNITQLSNFFVNITTLALRPVEDINKDESVAGVRDIAFTQIKDVDCAIVASANRFTLNSFTIGTPENQPNYIYTIDTNDQSNISGFNTPNPPNYFAKLRRFPVDEALQTLMFGDQKRYLASFVSRLNGGLEYFPHLLTGTQSVQRYISYLTEYDPLVKIPKRLRVKRPIQFGEALKYFYAIYGPTDWLARTLWRAPMASVVDRRLPDETMVQSLARTYHQTAAKTKFKLEATAFGNVYYNELLEFIFRNEMKRFVPTRLSIDLSGGKTVMTAVEVVYEQVTINWQNYEREF